jgi:CRISPR system Cascade subunit CasD
MDYLVFRLYGPLASWGQIAVGGTRPTQRSPGRSALLGLLAAALGIRRTEDDRLQRLQQSTNIAVKEVSAGRLTQDYHTSQVPSVDKKYLYRTRKNELAIPADKLNTVLSRRDYRCDGLWVIAVSLTASTYYSLVELCDALKQPAWPLYLGRKSCPLALPMSPQIVTTATLKNALDQKFPFLTASYKQDSFLLSMPENQEVTYYWQGDRSALDGKNHDNILTNPIWDEPVCRARWQFGPRLQHQLTKPRED